MPQLMPLMWINSSFMIILLMIIFTNLYYMKIENKFSYKMYYFEKKLNFMKW